MHKVKITTNGSLPSTMIEVDGTPMYVSDFRIEIIERKLYLTVTFPHPELNFSGECELEFVNGVSSNK